MSANKDTCTYFSEVNPSGSLLWKDGANSVDKWSFFHGQVVFFEWNKHKNRIYSINEAVNDRMDKRIC